MTPSAQRPLQDLIDQGRGAAPADLVLKGGRVFDLITGELVQTDVAICGDTIVGTFGSYSGRREIDVAGKVLVPGFIDTHLHIESSCVTPHEFDRCVTPRGVTTVICDPHEIANVCGLTGIRYDAVDRTLTVAPSIEGDFVSFLCTATGFGNAGVRGGQAYLEVCSGSIEVDRINYTPPGR